MPELIVTVLAVLAYIGIEGYYVLTGKPTISTHVRDLYRTYPPVAWLGTLVMGLLLGHFFWQQ